MALWTDLSTANTYFTTRINVSAWTGADDATKTAALTTAQNQLEDSGLWTFPDMSGLSGIW